MYSLKCDWSKFNQEEDKAPKSLDATKDQLPSFYEIVFEKKTNADATYLSVKSNFLSAFRLRSLTLRSLGLVSIDDRAFSNKATYRYLTTLDLSDNALKRFDSHLLDNLEQLEVLSLAYNNLKFSEKNFHSAPSIRHLNLSHNHMQFVTPHLFDHLENLDSVDLSHNSIRDIKACTFNNIQTNELARRFRPVVLDLHANPLTCDCDIFYLERYLKFKIKATCERPRYYQNKTIQQLVGEDPAYRCHYEVMDSKCDHASARMSTLHLVLIIGLATLALLFCCITCCCVCKSSSQKSKISQLRQELAETVENSKPKKIYANLIALESKIKKETDTQALLA